MAMIRVGLLGSGFMGRTHAAAWARLPVTFGGIVSEDKNSAYNLADAYHAKVYPELEAMLPHIDVLDICTPTHLHHTAALMGARAGKAIVCEKPLARTAHDARQVVEACAKAGVLLLVGHVVRFFPEYAEAKRLVDMGAVGQPAITRLSRCSFKPAADQPDNWFHDKDKSGGMLMDLMIHDYDYARWINGEVESVFARQIADTDSAIRGDHALVILRHTNGALTHIEGSWAYPKPLFRTSLEIAGDSGLIEHPADSSTPIGVHLHPRKPGVQTTPNIAVPTSPLLQDPYAIEMSHFYEVLSKRAQPRVTGEDALAAVYIALAALKSVETGRAVRPSEVA